MLFIRPTIKNNRRGFTPVLFYIRKRKMKKYILCGGKTSSDIKIKLQKSGYTAISLPPYKRLPEPVSSHPDMLVYRLSSCALLTYTEYYKENSLLFDQLGCGIVTEDKYPDKFYPRDICLNALRIGDTVFGRTDMLSGYILNDAKKTVCIRQGYARCSACIVDRNTLITADVSVASAVGKTGVDIILIENGYIQIDGYGYGFIGGTCGQLENAIAFCGDVMLHPSGEKITAAILSRGMDVIGLTNGVLVDNGGLMAL